MIVKNAGNLIEKVLQDNKSFIDRWCILDTGSTDGTQDIIKRVLKNKKGTLYEEPFVDFKVSRNRCLELAGKSCKFIMMLDDTYSIIGDLRNFLNEIRGDQFSDSFSLLIQSEDNEYYSNRIIKSKSNLRYIHKIHEVIDNNDNVNVTIPKDKAIIFDNRSEYMETRTMDRKQFDLQLLFKELKEFPDDPRSLYYIAQTYGCIGDEVNKAKYFELRINHPVEGYVQEKIDSYFELARCYNFKIDCFTKLPLTKLTTEQWENSDTIIFCHTNAERILSSNEEAHWIDWSKASPSSENELEKAIALHLKYFYNSEILHWSVKKWYEEINQSWSRTRTIHLHCFSTSWELRHLLTGLHVGPDLSSISLNEIDCPSMLYKDHRCNHLNKFNNKELAEQLCSLILNYDQGQVMLDTSKFQLVANTNI
jgi:glycosyltransferase involved in cell wall biosynthesis